MQMDKQGRLAWEIIWILLFLLGLLVIAARAGGQDAVPATDERPLPMAEAEQIWQSLAGSIEPEAVANRLREQPALIAALQKVIEQADRPTPEQIERLVRQLDSDRFVEREQAFNELVDLGAGIESQLRVFRQQDRSVEVNYRLEEIFRAFAARAVSPQVARRITQTLAVLEQTETEETIPVFLALAKLNIPDNMRSAVLSAGSRMWLSLLNRRLALADQALAKFDPAAADKQLDVAEMLLNMPEQDQGAFHRHRVTERQNYSRQLAGFLKQAAEVAQQLQTNNLPADADQRRNLGLMLITELGRTELALPLIDGINDAVLDRWRANRLPDPSNPTPEQLSRLAETYRQLAERAPTPAGKARMLARARDHYLDIVQPDRGDGEGRVIAGPDDLEPAQADALDRADQLDALLADLEPHLSMIGQRSVRQRISNAIIESSLIPITDRALGNHPGFHNPRLISKWYVVGPFDNPRERYRQDSHPPEQAINLRARFIGQANRELAWELVEAERPPIIPQPAATFATWYYYTEIRSDAERTVRLVIGVDDNTRIWLNDEQIFDDGTAGKGWSINQATVDVTLRRGINTLLFRMDNQGGATGFSVVMLDQN